MVFRRRDEGALMTGRVFVGGPVWFLAKGRLPRPNSTLISIAHPGSEHRENALLDGIVASQPDGMF